VIKLLKKRHGKNFSNSIVRFWTLNDSFSITKLWTAGLMQEQDLKYSRVVICFAKSPNSVHPKNAQSDQMIHQLRHRERQQTKNIPRCNPECNYRH
jgi:hypothetical protein